MLIAAQMTFGWNKDEPIISKPSKLIREESVTLNEISEEVPVEVQDNIIEENADDIKESIIRDDIDFSMNPKDKLYSEYSKDKFSDIIVDVNQEPELYNFVEQSKIRPRFNNYSSDVLTYFARRIYELRKNNSNYTAW